MLKDIVMCDRAMASVPLGGPGCQQSVWWGWTQSVQGGCCPVMFFG